MIGIVLIGHERIASEMLAALEHVLGRQSLIRAVDVAGDDPPETLRQRLADDVRSCDAGSGVLVLADMFGGTPCNVALAMMRLGDVEVVSGMNLPALIKAATLRQQPIAVAELAAQVAEAGRHYIRVATALMEGERGPLPGAAK
ncbi:MAG TPA: PTS sugar transporter subunit IIA [Mariprofundaceae bacterium]|nr:PTS sugar transporter subunit IIA [Mariprofundaceae bacterium]